MLKGNSLVAIRIKAAVSLWIVDRLEVSVLRNNIGRFGIRLRWVAKNANAQRISPVELDAVKTRPAIGHTLLGVSQTYIEQS